MGRGKLYVLVELSIGRGKCWILITLREIRAVTDRDENFTKANHHFHHFHRTLTFFSLSSVTQGQGNAVLPIISIKLYVPESSATSSFIHSFIQGQGNLGTPITSIRL